MSESPPRRLRMSLAEFMALPDETPTQQPPYSTAMPGEAPRPIDNPHDSHQRVIPALVVSLSEHVSPHELRLLPSQVRIDDNHVFTPDVFWVSSSNNLCVLRQNQWQGAPDLVIEVLSPTTASDDRGLKYDLYEKHGVREYWLVDPDAHYVEVYVNRNGQFSRQGVFVEGKSFTSEVLGGRSIDVDPLFS
jgi:Uma2 family endonuclease